MTHTIELKPETARAIEANAASQSLTPTAFLAGCIERMAQSQTFSAEEVRRMGEELFAERAAMFEALAESERQDRENAESQAPQ